MKVLIAEDNPMWATLLAENARQWKLQPIVVADGHEAIETWRNDPSICLVVLDWQMPGLSGIEVCQQIKSDSSRPFTYVMMLTSRDAKEDLVAGLDAGADNYLTKPVDMSVMKSQLIAATAKATNTPMITNTGMRPNPTCLSSLKTHGFTIPLPGGMKK